MSSDEEDDNGSSSKKNLDIANAIIFGNIDENGELIDDIFDEECKRNLRFLQPHLSKLVSYDDLMDDQSQDKSEEDDDSDDSKSKTKTVQGEM